MSEIIQKVHSMILSQVYQESMQQVKGNSHTFCYYQTILDELPNTYNDYWSYDSVKVLAGHMIQPRSHMVKQVGVLRRV